MIEVAERFPETPSAVDLQEYASTQHSLNSLLHVLSSAHSIEEIFTSIQADIMQLCDAEQFALYAVKREKRELYVKYASASFDKPQALRVPVTSDNVLGYSARRGKIVNIANAYAPEEWEVLRPGLRFDPAWDSHADTRTRQLLVVPMLIGQKSMMGVLCFVNKRHGERFTADDERTARHIAESLSVLLYNQAKSERATYSNGEISLEAITHSAVANLKKPEMSPTYGSVNPLSPETSQDGLVSAEFGPPQDKGDLLLGRVAAASSIEAIAPLVCSDILNLFDAEHLALYAVNREKQQLYLRWASPLFDKPNMQHLPITADNPLGYCARRGKSLNIADAYEGSEWTAIAASLKFDPAWDTESSFRIRQMLIVPMLLERRKMMGILVFCNKHHGGRFAKAEERLALRVAEAFGGLLNRQSQMDTLPQDDAGLSAGVKSDGEIDFSVAAAARESQSGEGGGAILPARLFGKFAYLLEQQLLTKQDLEAALSEARRKSSDVETLLVEEYRVPKKKVGEALSRFYGCPFIEFDEHNIPDRALLKGLNYDYLKANFWLPLRRVDAAIEVLIDNPKDLFKVEHIRMLLPNTTLRWAVGLRKDILQYLALGSGKQAEQGGIEHILVDLGESGEPSEETDDTEGIGLHENDSAIVRLANQIIFDAYNRGASDIHIEPYASRQDTVVRIRIDGICQEYQRIPPAYRRPLVSRLKIMARLDIAERRKPQDGKIKFRLPTGRDIELRVATLPTAGGDEDVVMRILAASEPLPMDALYMAPKAREAFDRAVRQPYGLVLVVGPTGSGKTTTLHAALGSINTPERKIWTAEDPVEITQYGLRQVQVQPRIGFTFAAAMRAFLRADPDVIMVGEMRDRETAQMGIEASLTGHLVFSTLHTNSAPETITRLLDMGLDPFNFADALLAILAQRLARTLCKACKVPYTPTTEEVEQLAAAYGTGFEALVDGRELQLHRGVGCQACQGSGYKGRIGLHELLIGSEKLRHLIQERAPVSAVQVCAQQEGMRTLLQDGIWKVLEGMTDFAQIRAVASK